MPSQSSPQSHLTSPTLRLGGGGGRGGSRDDPDHIALGTADTHSSAQLTRKLGSQRALKKDSYKLRLAYRKSLNPEHCIICKLIEIAARYHYFHKVLSCFMPFFM